MSYDSALELLRNAGAQKNQAASDGETPLLIAAVNNQRLVGQGMLRNASPAAKVRWGLRALSKVAHLSILGGARRGCAAGRTLTEATGRFVSLSCWIIACCSGVWFRSCAFRLVNLASSWPGGNGDALKGAGRDNSFVDRDAERIYRRSASARDRRLPKRTATPAHSRRVFSWLRKQMSRAAFAVGRCCPWQLSMGGEPRDLLRAVIPQSQLRIGSAATL